MQNSQPIFSRPIQWTLGVLSWLAFSIAAYLAWSAVTSSSVAGCGVGSHNGCDVVLNSSWSKWLLDIPVAVLGLACYAALAGLSILLGIQSSASRWITTAFVLLATLAAGASLWFIGVQVFAIGDFCLFCLTTDILGITIGALAAWCTYRWWSGTPQLRGSASSSTTLSALRSAIPSSSRLAPIAATRKVPASAGAAEATHAASRAPSTASTRSVPLVGSVASPSAFRTFALPPSMPIAYGGALALLFLLIGGQIVFPAKTFEVQEVALKGDIDLSATGDSDGSAQSSGDAESHVALRIPTEGDPEPSNSIPDVNTTTQEHGNGEQDSDTESNGSTAAPERSTPPEPKIERKIKLLGGKLTLDMANQPIIGSANAPHVVVELLSYDCQHCRKTSPFIKRALLRYGDQVALVVIPIPFESSCNRLITDPAASRDGACTTARTALALARLKPATFRQFHEFLMSGSKDSPPSRTAVLAKSFGMADRVKLQELRDSEEVKKQVAGYVDLFDSLHKLNSKNKEFGLPIQILGDHIMTGTVEKADDLYNAWETHLGVKPN